MGSAWHSSPRSYYRISSVRGPSTPITWDIYMNPEDFGITDEDNQDYEAMLIEQNKYHDDLSV